MSALVDLFGKLLTEDQVAVLNTLDAKHRSYMEQGRGREANAVQSCMQLVLHLFVGGRVLDPFQVTKHGTDIPT